MADIKNNIPNTTFTTDEDPFYGVTVTVNCDDGYTFVGTPTVTFEDSTFGDEETRDLTVSDDKNTATITSDEIGTVISLDGETTGGSEPVTPTVTNNVPNTTFEVEGDSLTLTCADGYVFDGTPTVNEDGSLIGDEMTVSSDNKIATYEKSGLSKLSFTIEGSTKEEKTTPTEPTVTNNVSDSTETHTVDGSNVTVKLVSNKVMLNVSCAYADTTGETKSVSVPVSVNVGVSLVSSTGEITLADVDFNTPVVITGDVKEAIPVTWTLSGCSSDSEPNYAFIGESFNVSLTADTGNEFSDGSKNYIEPQGSFAQEKVLLTISEDKKIATGTFTPVSESFTRDEELYIIGTADQIVSPTKKYGFINAYVVNEDNLETFATNRFVAYTGDSSTSDDPINYDLGDYVNRVKRFFFEVEKGSTSKLKCGNFVVDTDVYNLANDTKEIDFGTVDVPNLTGSTADYEADLLLFVPFVGVVSLDSDMIGKTISLSMKVNLLSGDGVYILTCDGVIRWTQSVKPTTDVIYRTSTQDVKVIGGTNFDGGYLMGLQPYVMVEKRTIVNTDCEVSAERFTKVSDVTGFAKVVNVHFADTANMMTDDIKEIESLLRNGFYV